MAQSISPRGTFAYPALFEPDGMEGQTPKYSVTIIFDKAAQATEEFAQLKKAVFQAAEARWGDKAADMFKQGKLRNPIRSCAEKSDKQGFEDESAVFVRFSTKSRPTVVMPDKSAADPEDVFGGVQGRVSYGCYAFDVSGNKGVAMGLNNAQLTKLDGVIRFDGRRSAFDEFTAVAENLSGGSADATAPADDLPF